MYHVSPRPRRQSQSPHRSMYLDWIKVYHTYLAVSSLKIILHNWWCAPMSPWKVSRSFSHKTTREGQGLVAKTSRFYPFRLASQPQPRRSRDEPCWLFRPNMTRSPLRPPVRCYWGYLGGRGYLRYLISAGKLSFPNIVIDKAAQPETSSFRPLCRL